MLHISASTLHAYAETFQHTCLQTFFTTHISVCSLLTVLSSHCHLTFVMLGEGSHSLIVNDMHILSLAHSCAYVAFMYAYAYSYYIFLCILLYAIYYFYIFSLDINLFVCT